MNVDDVKKLTVEKLKNELKARDLDITGKKADLAERLEAHLQAQPTEPSQQAYGASSSAVAHIGSSEATAAKTRKPIVWSASAPEAAATAPVATEEPAGTEPAAIPATEADTPAEKSESEKPNARTELGKRKLEEVETAALVSEEAIAKRRDRFKSQEDKALEDRKQRFSSADPKAAERKERFKQWLPSGGSSAPGMAKPANAEVAAALGTSLDKSTLGKGPKGRSRVPVAAPQTEKFSEEFKAKAEGKAYAELTSKGKTKKADLEEADKVVLVFRVIDVDAKNVTTHLEESSNAAPPCIGIHKPHQNVARMQIRMHKVVLQQHLQVAAQPNVCQLDTVLVCGLVHIGRDQPSLLKGLHQHAWRHQGVHGGGKTEVAPSSEVLAEPIKMLSLYLEVQLLFERGSKLAYALL
ncbi:MAG: hypothetical protein FRX49_00934 [Trebouxia sp. A1-2]|nr:MAG: hypothetical protein FRX49_00934 [Trebouxia sp. A1-2]